MRHYRRTVFLTLLTLLLSIAAIACTRDPKPSTVVARAEPLLLCLDPGHGGSDPGAVHPDGRSEKDDNLALALSVRDLLLERGIEVILTREDDINPTNEERAATANEAAATHYLALHRNSGGGAGIEAWIPASPTKEDRALGNAILDALGGCDIQADRGLKTGTAANPANDYRINSYTEMPSCILELGFIDNDTDNALLDANFEAYAQAIADALAGL